MNTEQSEEKKEADKSVEPICLELRETMWKKRKNRKNRIDIYKQINLIYEYIKNEYKNIKKSMAKIDKYIIVNK